jgi:hypothetical protein
MMHINVASKKHHLQPFGSGIILEQVFGHVRMIGLAKKGIHMLIGGYLQEWPLSQILR